MSDDDGGLDSLLEDSGPQMTLADPKLMEAGEAIFNTIWNTGCESWGVMLNRGVMFTSGSVDYNEPAALLPTDLGECLVTTVEWEGDRQGTLEIIVPSIGAKAVVAYWMALMAGGDPDPESQAMDEEGLDAYGEGINQFLGQAAQALRADPGGEVNLKAVKTRLVDFVASAPTMEFGNDFILCGDGQFTIEGSTPVPIYTLMTPSVTGVDLAIPEKASDEVDVDAAVMEASNEVSSEHTKRNREVLLKLQVPVHVNLATRKMRLSQIMELVPGSIVEFRKSSEEPLDLCVGDTVIARGEAVIVEEHFGIQLCELVARPKPE